MVYLMMVCAWLSHPSIWSIWLTHFLNLKRFLIAWRLQPPYQLKKLNLLSTYLILDSHLLPLIFHTYNVFLLVIECESYHSNKLNFVRLSYVSAGDWVFRSVRRICLLRSLVPRGSIISQIYLLFRFFSILFIVFCRLMIHLRSYVTVISNW